MKPKKNSSPYRFLSSLYGQIFLYFWSTLFFIVLGILTLQFFDPRVNHSLSTEDVVVMKTEANRIIKYLSFGDGFSFEERVARFLMMKRKHGPEVYFTNTQGKLYGEAMQLALNPNSRNIQNFISSSFDPSSPKQRVFDNHLVIIGPIAVVINDDPVWLYFSRRFDKMPSLFLKQLMDSPLMLLLIIMVISTPLLLLFSWTLAKPARRLQSAVRRVTQGEFDVDATLEKGPLEFSETGHSFNQMVMALNAMRVAQQRLLSDISHELRSPLTRLRLSNSLAIRKQGASKELERIDLEAQRLEEMILNLLSLSRTRMNQDMIRQRVDCIELWQDMLDDACFEAEQQGKIIIYSGLEPLKIEGFSELLTSALENVVRNAIKYSKQTTEIIFKHHYDPQHIDDFERNYLSIIVSDDGEGVPVYDLDTIFRPFYRTSMARDRETGGTGLGLTIAADAVRQHNGIIKASLNKQGGLVIEMVFPLSSAIIA